MCTLQISCTSLNKKPSQNVDTKNTILKAIPADCRNGDVRKGYLQPIVNGLEECQSTSQTCQNGRWVGPVLHTTCGNPTEFCDSIHPHGSTETGFTSRTAPCHMTSRTCLDGTWTEPSQQ